MPVVVEGVRERPLLVGTPTPLAGILSEPVERPTIDATFIVLNPGVLHRIGASRMNVMMCRALATGGFRAVRFDFSGIGDSETRPSSGSFSTRSVAEVQEVMDHLAAADLGGSFILAGLCSGADVAYQTALDDPRVEGVVCIDGHAYRTWRYWVHRYVPRLVRLESWRNLFTGRTYVGPLFRSLIGSNRDGSDEPDEVGVFRRPVLPLQEVAAGYQSLVDRGVHLLEVFTGGIVGHYNYPGQFRDAFASVAFGDRLTLGYFAGADHTFTGRSDRDRLISSVRSWVDERWARTRPTGSGTRPPAGHALARRA